MNKRGQEGVSFVAGAFVVLVIILLLASLPFIISAVKPWFASQDGKAELAQAEQNRQIKTLEAKATLESQELLSQAEVVKAEGIAKANSIISGSITEQYLKYKFIEALSSGSHDVIYVPTETNLPILEATRLAQ